MPRSTFTKLFSGPDYSTAPETTADIEGSILRCTPMTEAQRDAIVDPVGGMVVFNSTTNVLNFHNGSVWGAV